MLGVRDMHEQQLAELRYARIYIYTYIQAGILVSGLMYRQWYQQGTCFGETLWSRNQQGTYFSIDF